MLEVQRMIRYAIQFSDEAELVSALGFVLSDDVGPADVSMVLKKQYQNDFDEYLTNFSE